MNRVLMRLVQRGPDPKLGVSNLVPWFQVHGTYLPKNTKTKNSWDTKAAGPFHGFKSDTYTGQKRGILWKPTMSSTRWIMYVFCFKREDARNSTHFPKTYNEFHMVNHVFWFKREDTRNSTHFPGKEQQAALWFWNPPLIRMKRDWSLGHIL